MERLSIQSFLKNGHPFHLFAYNELEELPEGAVLKDANEVLPESSIFMYEKHASYAGFANFFRYKLLLERGGWWADLDMVCLKPFDFTVPFVFSSESDDYGSHVNVGAIKVPLGSAVMQYAWNACQAMDPKQLKWRQCGPSLFESAVQACSLEGYVVAPSMFCPVGFYEWKKLIDPAAELTFGEDTRALHCWNELWRRSDQSKDAPYHPDCLYERMKQRYLR